MKIIAFFNSKGGVGTTSLVYHLAWMYAELGLSVIAADLDPQANLTTMFVEEERLEQLWPDDQDRHTVFGALQPLLDGTGDIMEPHVEPIDMRIGLLVGDLALATTEDELNAQWSRSIDGQMRAFPVLSAFRRLIERAAAAQEARLALIDIGPNLDAINRAALVAADFVVIPLAPDLYSLQGLRDLGSTLRRWRSEWRERYMRNPAANLPLPSGAMTPAGYVVMQHAVRLDRPVLAYDRWMARIPSVYRESVLDEPTPAAEIAVTDDPNCVATLRHYRSLMPMAQEARKPMFLLRPADGALGGHMAAVRACYEEFRSLAQNTAQRCDVTLP